MEFILFLTSILVGGIVGTLLGAWAANMLFDWMGW